jgi:hypothetical protein
MIVPSSIIRAPTTPQKPKPPPLLLLQLLVCRRRRLGILLHFQRKCLLSQRRRRQISLSAPKSRIPLIVNSINTPQEHAAQNIEFLVSARLNPAISRAVLEVLERKIAGLDLEEGVADAEGDSGQGREVGGGGEDPALLA